jgi:hypothetical protein
VALALHLVERITAANGRVARGVTHGARAIWRRMGTEPSRRQRGSRTERLDHMRRA